MIVIPNDVFLLDDYKTPVKVKAVIDNIVLYTIGDFEYYHMCSLNVFKSWADTAVTRREARQ